MIFPIKFSFFGGREVLLVYGSGVVFVLGGGCCLCLVFIFWLSLQDFLKQF